MTLPKIFSSKSFNNLNTMSFEQRTIANTNSLLSHPDQQQYHHQSAQNTRQEILRSLNPLQSTMSSHSPVTHTTNSDKNNAMFDVNLNSHVALSPLQLIAENQETQLLAECVMPGIYLTKDFISWKEEQLRAHGFTHIIIIDKHIQELYYPNQQPDIFKLCSMRNEKAKNLRHVVDTRENSSSLYAFDDYCPLSTTEKRLSFGKEYQVIDLNFGEKAYLTTVLPNCYKAVKFIDKALQSGGKILVIDCNGAEQKCITIIVAYLMFKDNISFSNAFARLKEFYNKADLDRFYISQLYEYEPILQVQRAQSRGHSCSRKLHADILKRKKSHEDDEESALDNSSSTCLATSAASSLSGNVYTNTSTYTNATTATELLNNCNPLNRFDSSQMERRPDIIKSSSHHNNSMTPDNHNNHAFTRFMSGMTSPTTTTSTTVTTTGGWYNWDDYAME